MNKYEIKVIEQYTGVYEIEGEDFKDAENRIEDKIDSGEIILDNIDTYIRNYENNRSKELNEDINMFIGFDSKTNTIKIFHDDKELIEKTCFTVRDLKEIFEDYCNEKLEDKELPLEINQENNMEV